MKTLIHEDTKKTILCAAAIVANTVRSKPNAVLGLATGGTMLPLYRELRRMHVSEGLSFADVTTFNLDEYVGLAPDHACSYHTYMDDALFRHIDVDRARTYLPRGDAADLEAETEAYESMIRRCGGIDLQLLGIGSNGHIGFNEPTSSLSSRTRIKTLTIETRRANRQYFDCDEDTPRYALTMGVGTILASRACLLIANGSSKADAVARMVEGPVSTACPASALQMHAKTTVVLDREAAAQLELKAYYEHVHPGGRDNAFD